jgi:hypothetical protein
MSDQPENTYPVEPQRPAPGSPPEPGKPRIEAPGLLEGFEEDADFTADPELDRATGKIPPARLAGHPAAAPPETPDFVTAGVGKPLYWAAAGGVLLIAALIATGVNAPNRAVLRILLVLYNVLLHTGTGVVAVYLAATLLERRVRFVETVAARMLVAVSAMALLISTQIRIFPPKYDTKAEEIVLGLAAYGLIVAASFNLWKRLPFLYVVGCHFALWLIVQLGMALSEAVAAAPLPKPVPGG